LNQFFKGQYMEGQKVKLLTIEKNPEGIITRSYYAVPGGGSLCPGQIQLYWIRLNNGTLLKDVTHNEFDIIRSNI